MIRSVLKFKLLYCMVGHGLLYTCSWLVGSMVGMVGHGLLYTCSWLVGSMVGMVGHGLLYTCSWLLGRYSMDNKPERHQCGN